MCQRTTKVVHTDNRNPVTICINTSITRTPVRAIKCIHIVNIHQIHRWGHTSYIVIKIATQIRINPPSKITISNIRNSFIDKLISLKSHIINFIVSCPSKCFYLHFHMNGFTLRFGMTSTSSIIIINPEKHFVGINSGRAFSSSFGSFNMYNRIIPVTRIILCIFILIKKRSQIMISRQFEIIFLIKIRIAFCRPIFYTIRY